MKKYGILACAALVSLLGGRLNAAVESDIVGYTTITMEAGYWYQIGCPFVTLSDDADAYQLNNIFGAGFVEGDIVYIFDTNAGTYTQVYEWCENAAGSRMAWCDGTTKEEANVSLAPGQAVFIYKKGGESKVTFAGKVDATTVTSIGVESSACWTQVTCQYPASIAINDMKWDGMSIDDVMFLFDSDAGTYTKTYTWRMNVAGTRNAWCDGTTGKEAEDIIEPGQAFFIHKKTAGVAGLSKGTL